MLAMIRRSSFMVRRGWQEGVGLPDSDETRRLGPAGQQPGRQGRWCQGQMPTGGHEDPPLHRGLRVAPCLGRRKTEHAAGDFGVRRSSQPGWHPPERPPCRFINCHCQLLLIAADCYASSCVIWQSSILGCNPGAAVLLITDPFYRSVRVECADDSGGDRPVALSWIAAEDR
jgi:hypothetical protein